MDRLYDWVDANPPSPDRSFSSRRAAKLFLAIMACSILGGIPYGLIQFGVWLAKEAEEERQHQEQLRLHWNEAERAVRDGTAGEATQRLFGVKRSPVGGTLQGVIRFTGTLPPAQEILTTEGLKVVHRDLLVDAKTKGLRFVVAMLEDAPAQPKVEKAEPVVMDQKDMVFVPRVVAVRHGRPVRFDNSDGCNHSVMTASTVPANQFNIFVNGHTPYTHVFEPQKHPVAVGCALHAWMKAWVYVVPHPWFAVTDEQGVFKIESIPPGKYTLWLRHADSGLSERREVAVAAGKTSDVTVEWDKVGK